MLTALYNTPKRGTVWKIGLLVDEVSVKTMMAAVLRSSLIIKFPNWEKMLSFDKNKFWGWLLKKYWDHFG